MIAQAQHRPPRECAGLRGEHAVFVDPRAVGAIQVVHQPAGFDPAQLRVVARDALVGDDHVVVGCPPQPHHARADLEREARPERIHQPQPPRGRWRHGLNVGGGQVGQPQAARALDCGVDLGDKQFCEKAVEQTVRDLGGLDVLVNNAGEQHPDEDIRDITEDQLKRTFQTNIFGMFFLTQAALDHLKEGSAIINCTSVTMYKGSPQLLDYSATKGAITAFTRSLSKNLVEKGIRVNAVAPGPIWTPLNPFGGQKPEDIPEFGKDTPMGRPGQPNEVAPSFLFLACEDSSYMVGQVLHPNGGDFTSS